MLLESKNKALKKNQIFFFEINIPEKNPTAQYFMPSFLSQGNEASDM